jgi:hypothetical protein
MIDIYDLQTHPAAEIFPMLSQDELEELATDIKAKGLQNPIALAKHEGKTVIIDGRNRRAACRIAKVEPTTVMLNGIDPVSYIVSANINRRHMTKGQRAMALAILYPEKGHGQTPNNLGFATEYLRQARTVLKVLPETAQLVLAGKTVLNDAYAAARAQVMATKSEEQKFSELQRAAPDLADLVTEGRMTLADAVQALEGRKIREREGRIAFTAEVKRTITLIIGFAANSAADEEWVSDMDLTEFEEQRDSVERGWKVITGILGRPNSQSTESALCPRCDGEGCRWCDHGDLAADQRSRKYPLETMK